MSALSDALTAAGITYAWGPSTIRGRVALWLRMGGEPIGLLTMTGAQARLVRDAMRGV